MAVSTMKVSESRVWEVHGCINYRLASQGCGKYMAVSTMKISESRVWEVYGHINRDGH